MRAAFCFLLCVLPAAAQAPEALWREGNAALDALRAPRFERVERPAAPAEPLPECPAPADDGLSEALGSRLLGLEPAPALPAFEDDLDLASLEAALARTLAYWDGQSPAKKVKVGPRVYDAARLRASAAALLEAYREAESPAGLLARLRRDFDAYASIGSDGGGVVTLSGYYEATLAASFERDAAHPFPAYGRPADLVRLDPALGSPYDYGRVDEKGRVTPHFSRAEVSAGALAAQAPLFWVKHPTDLLILHTEGSGVLHLPGGATQRVGFDGANGRPFRSVGRELIRCGLLPPDATGRKVLDYLKSQPLARETRLVDLNPRYIFMRRTDRPPTGAMGAELTAGRSVALDPAIVPLGAVALLAGRRPTSDGSGKVVGARDFARTVAAQDTGSAIRGPGRLDLYYGSGARAEEEARAMWYPGRLYVLVLKDGKEAGWRRSRS